MRKITLAVLGLVMLVGSAVGVLANRKQHSAVLISDDIPPVCSPTFCGK